MLRFPTRTLVLMALALLAFVWMWVQTHRAAPLQPPLRATVVGPGALQIEAPPAPAPDR
jgi:hypothetical protein